MEGIAVSSGRFPPGVDGVKGPSVGSASSSPSVAKVAEVASIGRKLGEERADGLEHLASRATQIATRLAGSYPCAAPPRDPSSNNDRSEPRSALDDLLRQVSDVRGPLYRMDPALAELSAALDVIERAIG